MEVIVYRLSSCGFCKQLLDTLTAGNVQYIVRQSQDPNNQEDCRKMDALFESTHYPKVVVKKSNETLFIVSNQSKKLPHVDGIKFFYYATPQDVLDIIKTEK